MEICFLCPVCGPSAREASMAPLWFLRTGWVGLVGLVLGFPIAQGRGASVSETILTMLTDCSKLGLRMEASWRGRLWQWMGFLSCTRGIAISRKAPFLKVECRGHIMLYEFQVYNMVIGQVCMLCCAPYK